MSDVILYLSVAGALVVISFILSLIFRRRTAEDDGKASDELRDPDQAPVNRQAGPRRVAGARQVRSRFEAQRARQEQRRRDAPQEDPDFDRQSGSDDEEDDGGAGDDIVFPGGKIGVKKRRKLEMKAEKRAQREAELQDREDKKMRQAKEDEERRRQQEHEKQEEMKREEEAKKIREEKAKKEHEAYLQLKQSFQVESEGFEEKDNEEENDLLTKFVEYIKSEKVIVLEDLAVRFNLKTQEAIDRVHSLLQDGTLIGVIDDRGKFIYITAEELESIARFIRQRGRVSIADIAESSNTLISLASKQTVETN